METGHKTANVFGHNAGTGLTRHIAIVVSCLEAAGYRVALREVPERRRGARLAAVARKWKPSIARVDLNVFVQDLVPSWFHRARTNMLLPNQEWFGPADLKLLSAVDHIICTSQHATDAFSFRGPAVTNLGFTSEDRRSESLSNNSSRILHVAGRSPYKGTRTLVDLWKRHPEWPKLTIVHHPTLLEQLFIPNIDQRAAFVDDATLRQLQNDAWLHIVPTEAEAFGHSICEALSVGALTITTDAPPMNELVRCSRGILVPAIGRERLHLGYRFFVDPSALESAIQCVLDQGPDHHAERRQEAREWFERNDRRVRAELTQLFSSVT